MPTLDQIQEQINKYKFGSVYAKEREVKELPTILSADEELLAITGGQYHDGHGILVGTNIRLIFIDKGLLFGLKVEDFPYEKISSIEYKQGLMFGTISIYTSGNKADITYIPNIAIDEFVGFVRNMTHKTENVAEPQTSTQDQDLISKLERLASLKEKGVLTDEEFNEQKKKLLSQ